jgi:hypothetical protein
MQPDFFVPHPGIHPCMHGSRTGIAMDHQTLWHLTRRSGEFTHIVPVSDHMRRTTAPLRPRAGWPSRTPNRWHTHSVEQMLTTGDRGTQTAQH